VRQSLLLAAAFTLDPVGSSAEPPRVELTLTAVEAFPNGRDTLFVLGVEVDNRTGREQKVRSSFTSALDALVLVVRDETGKELGRQSVSAHKSPFSIDGRLFPLAAGKTRHELRVSIELPAGGRAVRVSLHGTLPGSGIDDLLLTDVRPVTVRPAR